MGEVRTNGRRGSYRRPSMSITEVLESYQKHNTQKMRRRSSNRFRDPVVTTYEPWKYNETAPQYVKTLEKQVLDSWGLVFCGRNASVSKMLHNVTDKFDIAMFEERYEW